MNKKYLICSNFESDVYSDERYDEEEEAMLEQLGEVDEELLDEWVEGARDAIWESVESHFQKLKMKPIVWKIGNEYDVSLGPETFSSVFAINRIGKAKELDVENYPFRIYDDGKRFVIESAIDNEDKTILVAEGRLMTPEGVKKSEDLSQSLKAIYEKYSAPINFSKELGIEWINDKGGK